jgi:hypothetical protein
MRKTALRTHVAAGSTLTETALDAVLPEPPLVPSPVAGAVAARAPGLTEAAVAALAAVCGVDRRAVEHEDV